MQGILNHSTPQITLKHIGINKEGKDNILDTFQI
ncbi:integrase [Bacillus pseudomycoides]|nr:integrase [Bacillus pseudomycoides]